MAHSHLKGKIFLIWKYDVFLKRLWKSNAKRKKSKIAQIIIQKHLKIQILKNYLFKKKISGLKVVEVNISKMVVMTERNY